MLSMIVWMGGGGAAGGEGQGNPLTMLLMFVLIFLIFYLLIIRPQQKRQREHQRMLGDIKNGDRVVTAGGLIGNVVGTKDEEGVAIIVIKIAENTKVEVSRSHVQQVLLKQR
ncbi:MAG: preprotein translocase subunit YajC [Candidatus Eisenbacteria bacterium]